MPVRILITDDHAIVREGIRTLIARSRPEWEICGEATNGEEAIAACRTLKPDVIILDVTMPRMSGLEAASQISTLNLGCRVLIFTMHESERLSEEVQQTGAQGFVLKSQAARDLIRAIDIILKGGTFFGPGPRMKRTLRELVLQLFHPTDPIQLNAYSRTLVPCQASSKPQAAASLRQSFVDGAALPGVGGINFLGFPFRDHGWRKTTETQRGSQWIGSQ